MFSMLSAPLLGMGAPPFFLSIHEIGGLGQLSRSCSGCCLASFFTLFGDDGAHSLLSCFRLIAIGDQLGDEIIKAQLLGRRSKPFELHAEFSLGAALQLLSISSLSMFI